MPTRVLELVEYDNLPIPDDLVRTIDASFWKELGIKISRTPDEAGWQARADSFSGVARVHDGELDLTVVIRPKLAGADVVFLAEYAYGQRVGALRRPKADRVGVDSDYADPVAAFLVWYVEAVSDFATRWLRRNYRSRQVTLHGKVRGRFLVSRYVSQNLSTARNADIPAIITERTIDTPNNRLLKAGLRQVAKLAATLPGASARRAVRGAVNAALPRFAEVADTKIGSDELRATTTNGPERHYAAILQATKDLLGGTYLGVSLGTVATESFLWSMPHLFQEALRSILHEWEDAALDRTARPSGRILDGDGATLRRSRIDPDYVLDSQTGRLLLDAKYKDALRNRNGDIDALSVGANKATVNVSRSDLYQMVAYRQQPTWAGAATVLVYPIVLTDAESLPRPHQFFGLGEPVSLIFIDIGPRARLTLPAFYEQIRSLRPAG